MKKELLLMIVIAASISMLDTKQRAFILKPIWEVSSDVKGRQITAFFKRTKKNSKTKRIKKQCQKAKLKIRSLEDRARRKSTAAIQRCKRAYSELRYQACHLKKNNIKVVEAAKNCNK